MASGHCNCGQVAFEIDADITDVYVCHCSICRRSTGANGIAVVVVDNEKFRWVEGENLIRTWDKPSHDWQSSFCTHCGSTLPGRNDEARMYVPAGLLAEGDKHLKVAHHIWVGSKAAWDEIGDGGRQHPQAFSSES